MITLQKHRRKDPNTKKFVFYPRWKKNGKVTKSQLAEIAARQSTFSKGEIEGQYTDFPQYIVDQVLQGNEVYLEGFGTFYPHVSGPSHENPGKITTEGLEITIRFKPDKSLQSRLDTESKFKFVPVQSKE